MYASPLYVFTNEDNRIVHTYMNTHMSKSRERYVCKLPHQHTVRRLQFFSHLTYKEEVVNNILTKTIQ